VGIGAQILRRMGGPENRQRHDGGQESGPEHGFSSSYELNR
jgi:hypothetical protein